MNLGDWIEFERLPDRRNGKRTNAQRA